MDNVLLADLWAPKKIKVMKPILNYLLLENLWSLYSKMDVKT